MAHTPLPYKLEETCALLHIRTRNAKCPLCGGRTSFSINEKKQVWHCMKCDESGNATTLYAKVMGISSKEAYRQLQQALGGSLTIDLPKLPEDKNKESESPLADIDVRHKTYCQMLRLLPLDDKHRADLAARGFRPNYKFLYRTFDLKNAAERKKLAAALIEKGCQLEGVPGFYRDARGDWTVIQSKRGILVPYLNEDRKIQGLQIRKDNSVLTVFPDGHKETKYVWFSSAYIPKNAKSNSGTRAVTNVHYAAEFDRQDDGSYAPVIIDNTVFLTEGAMKADLAHSISRMTFIAVPGVNALASLEKELRALKDRGVKFVANAYDMDYVTNPNVQKAQERTKEMIEGLGMIYSRITWDDLGGKLKGIDDYYAYLDAQRQKGKEKK